MFFNLEENFIFFDTETTGIIKNEENKIITNGDLIQLAYKKIYKSGKIEFNNFFFNTDTCIQIQAMSIHGIYKELLEKKSKGKYLDKKTRNDISKVLTSGFIIAHNIDFDVEVLSRFGIKFSDKQIDTLKVAKVLLLEGILKNIDGLESELLNLQYLRYFFGLYEINDDLINNSGIKAHDALSDVLVLEQVFYKLFNIIKEKFNYTDKEVILKMQEISNEKYFILKKIKVGKYRGKTFEEVLSIDKKYLKWILKGNFSEDLKYTCRVWLGLEEEKKFFN